MGGFLFSYWLLAIGYWRGYQQLTKSTVAVTEWNMHSYTQLNVWKMSFKLAESIYRLSAHFPAEERYGLVSQIRRSAVSISSNIAEGKGKLNDNELRRYLLIANGSALELDTQLRLAKSLFLLPQTAFAEAEELLTSVMKLLNQFIFKLTHQKPKANSEKPIANCEFPIPNCQ